MLSCPYTKCVILLCYIQTQANDGDTPYNGIPLDIIPAATPGVITRESLGRALRRAHQRRIAERRQVNYLLCYI